MAVQVGKKKKKKALNTNILKLFGHNACLISYEKVLQGWKKNALNYGNCLEMD